MVLSVATICTQCICTVQGAVMSFIGAIVVVAIVIALATYSNKWNNAVKLLTIFGVRVPPVLDVLNSSTIASTVSCV